MGRKGFGGAVAALGLAALFQPAAALALDKDDFRNEAKANAATLRSAGEPLDRCSLGAFLQNGGIVTQVHGPTSLQEGDQLTRLNGIEVGSMSSEELVSKLRAIAPNAVVPVTLRRNGTSLELQVSCANSRPGYEVILAGLDQAANKKFDDCVQTFGSRQDLGFFGAMMKLRCAAFSKKSKGYNLGNMTYDVMKMAVENARWTPSSRQEVLQRLRASEGIISFSMGKSAFGELIQLTRRWPGDEQAWDKSEPDWGLFRSNSETALRARLIDPDSARIEWPYGFTLGTWKPLLSKTIEGYWSCGLINARNRMGGYTGSTYFVVVLSPEGYVKYADMGDASDFDIVSSQCSGSLKHLPPPPEAFTAEPAIAQAQTSTSLADELAKLVQLRDSGAITQEEYDAAKAKVLTGSH